MYQYVTAFNGAMILVVLAGLFFLGRKVYRRYYPK
jgi:hypothetical protein